MGQFTHAYTLAGQYDAITFPNAQTRSFAYDDQGRLTGLVNLHPSVGTLASFAYGYDIDPKTQQPTLLGQRTGLAMTIPSQGLASATSGYRYDASYQVTQASYPAPAPYNGEVHGWTYDGLGNRLTQTVNGVPQAYTYFKNGTNPLNGQRLSSDGIDAYTYDANGNTITRTGPGGSFTLAWSPDDRMTGISGAVTASYRYDYQGRRSGKTVSGASTSYLYDGLNLIRATGPSSTTEYVFGPGIDEPLASVQGGNVSYFAVDGLGSVALLSDASGTVKNSFLYDAWGVVRSQASTVANDFGYTAREVGEAGLWFYRARYYQAGIGRFGSEDPIWRETGKARVLLRLFRYLVDPVRFVDPMGLWAVDPSCKCPPFSGSAGGGGMEDEVKKACNYFKNRECRGFLIKNFADQYWCMEDRCRDRKIPVRCGPPPERNVCGWTPPFGGGSIWVYSGSGGDACPASSGGGYAPTIFHEAMHSCGIMRESYDKNAYGPRDRNFENAERICSGWTYP